jgi:hypothetical protein
LTNKTIHGKTLDRFLYIHQVSIMPKMLVIPRSGVAVDGICPLRSSSSSASSRFIVAVFESGKGSSQLSDLPFFFQIL